jgi:hypothetical protein
MNRKRAVIFLFGGISVLVLLTAGLLFYAPATAGEAIPGVEIVEPTQGPLGPPEVSCLDATKAKCVTGAETVNTSVFEDCQGNLSKKIRETDELEFPNESTDVIKCKTD